MCIAFNHIAAPEKYSVVGDILRGEDRSAKMSIMERSSDCESAFIEMLEDLDIAVGLCEYGIKREDLAASAERAFAAKPPPE